MNMKEGAFGLDIRKFLARRVVRDWHMLPREMVHVLSLKTFKARLDGL